MRIFAGLCVCLVLAACGGDGNTADAVPSQEQYLPDFSTPEGATLAFMRAFETGNQPLLSMTLLDAERDLVLPSFEHRFAESRTWKLQQLDSEFVAGKEARSLLLFSSLKNGKPTGEETREWHVFVLTPEGTWKYSGAATEAFAVRKLATDMTPGQPDLSTLVGAMAAFVRAVETGDKELLAATLPEAERNDVVALWDANFKRLRDEGLQLKLDIRERLPVRDGAARVFSFTELKDGKPTGDVAPVITAFVQTPDGSWRYSNAASKRVSAALRKQSKPD